MHRYLRGVRVAKVSSVRCMVVVAVRKHDLPQCPRPATRIFEFSIKGCTFLWGAGVN